LHGVAGNGNDGREFASHWPNRLFNTSGPMCSELGALSAARARESVRG